MGNGQFEFDENGDTFFCFLVAFYTLALIPVSYFCWPPSDSRDPYETGKRKCMCQPCQVKRHYLKASTPWKRFRKLLVKGTFAIAWLILFIMIYKLTLMENVEVGFDPFAQLELERDASMKDIRTAYKRLSVKYHPDKGGDPKRFILISKAYAALTNEESRKNWEEYGNPDGPGAAHFGIALPKWMVQQENSYLVIGAYVILFMLILPITVGMWWYNTMKFSSNKVLLDTIRYFCGTFMRSPYMALPRVINVLSNAYEFNPNFNKEIVCRPSDNVELPPLVLQIPMFTIFKKAIVGSPSSVKARALIYAHMERLDLPANTLHLDRQYIVKNCPRLLDEMINTLLYILNCTMDEAGARQKIPQHLATIENCIRLMPMLIQALSDSASPLLQLPHVTPVQLRYMLSKQRNIKSIRQIVQLPEEKRRSLFRSLSDEEYRDIMNVCSSMPLLEISYRCEVLDDDDPSIWPLSMVTATITLKRHPLYEPSTAASSTANVTEAIGNNIGSPRSDWSTYDHHSNESQLYAAADINADSGAMNYGDFPDEMDIYPNGHQKPKKTSTTPIWDKNKRKKQPRKGKHRKQQQHHQARTVGSVDKGQSIRESGDCSDVEDVDEAPPALVDGESDDAQEFDADNAEQDSVDETADDAIITPPSPTTSRPSPSSTETKTHCTHMAHCPYFPVEKFEGWWIYLVDRKTRQLITRPMYIATLQTEEEIPLRFVAPPVPGAYFYTLCVRSDSYLDCDFFETVRFNVSPLPERVVQYFKEKNEAHTDSSASDDSDVSDAESNETDEDQTDEEAVVDDVQTDCETDEADSSVCNDKN